MSRPTFAQLLTQYMQRSGISDAELARTIGVRRQTIFRWKEGLVERPRVRDDVLRCSQKLRLTPEERDFLLLAAGFAPDTLTPEAAAAAFVTIKPEPTALEAAGAEPDDETLLQPEIAAPLPGVDVAEVAAFTEQMVTEVSISLPAASQLDALADVPTQTVLPDLLILAENEPSPLNATQVAVAAAQAPLMSTAISASTPSLPITPPVITSSQRWRFWSAASGLAVLLLALTVTWRFWPATLLLPTPTVLPAATPRPIITLNPPPQSIYPQAAPGEFMVLVATFSNYAQNEGYNVAGRIQEQLREQIAKATLISTTVALLPEEVRSPLHVQTIFSASDATLLIWGEYDSGRVRVNLDIRGEKESQQKKFEVQSNDELVTLVNSKVPSEIQLLALTALGRIFREQEQYPKAVIAFQQALNLDPEDQQTQATLHFYLGTVTESMGTLPDLKQAVWHYGHAIELNPKLTEAFYNRGNARYQIATGFSIGEDDPAKFLSDAIDDFTKALAIRPGYWQAYVSRGAAYNERHQAGDVAAALQDLNRVVELAPQDFSDLYSAYYSRGLVRIRAGGAEDWAGDLQKSLELKPSYYNALSALCWGYALAQEAETAIPYCDKAVQYDTSGISNDSRAIAYAQLGQYAAAIADFEKYLTSLRKLGPAAYKRYRGPWVEQWIAALQRDENPFDQTLLDSLR